MSGFAGGAVGTAALGVDKDAGYGLIVSGLGQGIVWTAMWITAATGTGPEEQGVANGAASTGLNLGNAIGLAVFTALADRGTDGKSGEALRAATADGEFLVVLLTAAAMAGGLLIALTLRRQQLSAPDGTEPGAPTADTEPASPPALTVR
ncbi:hypothetical protein [Streptomyces uncialis]|uniref:hypothetical protein n=1 Tax=Streptomyces uncialis TaxID=1048205 RepID=UPI0033F7E160